MANSDKGDPCGRCSAGTYAYGAIVKGISMFESCDNRRAALNIAPRCESDPSHICYGARDFIRATQFPIDRAAMMEMLDK